MIILQKRELGLRAEGRRRSKGCRSGIQTHDWKGPGVKAGFQGSQEEDRWLRAETAAPPPKSSARKRGQKQSWEGAAPRMEAGQPLLRGEVLLEGQGDGQAIGGPRGVLHCGWSKSCSWRLVNPLANSARVQTAAPRLGGRSGRWGGGQWKEAFLLLRTAT